MNAPLIALAALEESEIEYFLAETRMHIRNLQYAVSALEVTGIALKTGHIDLPTAKMWRADIFGEDEGGAR